jgi:hypothetical protein
MMGVMAETSTYRSNAGPVAGPARGQALPSPIGVHADPDASGLAGFPIGMAFASTGISDEPWPPIRLWRLVIGKAELPGRFVLGGRVFVPVDEWLVAHGRGDATAD